MAVDDDYEIVPDDPVSVSESESVPQVVRGRAPRWRRVLKAALPLQVCCNSGFGLSIKLR